MKKFIAASAKGQDWREVTKHLVRELSNKIGDSEAPPNIGFLYVTDKLLRDAQSLLELLKSVTGVHYWVGVSGAAVLSADDVYFDKPAASCLLLHCSEEDFSVLDIRENEYARDLKYIAEKYRDIGAVNAHLYCRPELEVAPNKGVSDFYKETGGFFTGGLASSRSQTKVFTQNGPNRFLGGVAFNQNVQIASNVAEGFLSIGEEHEITGSKSNYIYGLDGDHATAVLSKDLREWLAQHKVNDEPPIKFSKQAQLSDMLGSLGRAHNGEVHIAFKQYQHDIKNQHIRSLLSCSDHSGWLETSEQAQEGDQLAFVFRDSRSLKKDLAQSLMKLRARLQENGQLDQVKGGVYISNISRLSKAEPLIETTLIREIIGDIPLAGFYSSGEISHHHLYSFSGVLTLFL